jgi:hypothetical protein
VTTRVRRCVLIVLALTVVAAEATSCRNSTKNSEAPPSAEIQTHRARPALHFAEEARLRILDGDGRSLSGGSVWLSVPKSALGAHISSRAVVREGGTTTFKLDEKTRQALTYASRATLWLVDSQFRLNGADIPADVFASDNTFIEVCLPKPRELVAVTVLDSSGSPAVHARVGPDSVAFSPADPGHMVPDEVWKETSMLTNSAGQCTAWIPLGDPNGYVRITAEQLGIQILPTDALGSNTPYVFRLGECERVVARLADDSEGSVMLEAISRLPLGQSSRANFELTPSRDKDAWLLAEGSLVLRPRHAGATRLVPHVAQAPQRVAKGAPTRLLINMTPGVKVGGRIFKGSAKEPVAGARVMWSGSALYESFIEPQTDEHGHYEFRCVGGKLQTIGAVHLPGAAYIHVPAIELEVSQDAGEITVRDIALPDFVWMRGRLLDSADEPMPQEDVSYGHDQTRRLGTTTGTGGNFWLPVEQPISDAFYLVLRTPVRVEERDALILRMNGKKQPSSALVRVIAEN